MSEKGGNSVASEKPKKSATTATKRSTKGLNSSRTTSTKSNGGAKTDTEKRLERGLEKPKKTTTDSLKKPNREPLSVEQRSKSETSKRTTSSFSNLSRRPPPIDKAPTPRERLSSRARPGALGKSHSAQTPSPKRTSTEKKAEEEFLAVTPRTQSDLTMQRRPRRPEDSQIEKSLSSRSASRCSTPLVPKPSAGSRSSSRNSTPSVASKSREFKPSMREKLWLTSPRTQSSTPRKEPSNYVKSGSFTQRPRSPKDTKPARRLSVPPRNISSIKRESVSPGPTIYSSSSHTKRTNLANKKSIRSNSTRSSRTLDEKGRKLSTGSTQPTEDGKSSELDTPVLSYSFDDSQLGTEEALGRTVSRNSTPSPIPMDRPSLTSSQIDLKADNQFDTTTEEQERLTCAKQRVPSPDTVQVHLMSNNITSEASVEEKLGQSECIVATYEGPKEESIQETDLAILSKLEDQIKSIIEETSKDEKQEHNEEVKDLVIKVEKKRDVGSHDGEVERVELPTSPFAKHIYEDILANVALDAENSDIKPDALEELHKTPSSPKAKQPESPMEPTVTEDQSKDENKEQPEMNIKTTVENEAPPVEAYLTESVLKMQDNAYSPKGAITSRWLMDQASDTFYSRSWSGMDKVEDPCFEKEDTVPIPEPEQSNNRVSIEDFIKPESFTKKNKDIIAVDDPTTFDPATFNPKPKAFLKQKERSPRVADPDDDDFESIPKKKRNFISRCAVCIFGGLAVTFFFVRNRAKSMPTN